MKGWLDGKDSYDSPWDSFLMDKNGTDDPDDGYFWTDQKQYLLLFVTPRRSGESFAGSLEPLTALRGTISQVQTRFPGIRAGVTGRDALDSDEMGSALHDMGLATLISLVSLVVLLILFWRGFRKPLLEIVQLLVALSLTFGLTTLFIGHLNILSVSFAPMLLGLGIDYGVHWVARYREEQEARSRNDALQATMMSLGPGILLAGLSAALSFLPLTLTGSRAWPNWVDLLDGSHDRNRHHPRAFPGLDSPVRPSESRERHSAVLVR